LGNKIEGYRESVRKQTKRDFDRSFDQQNKTTDQKV